ncbi:hypothetical protein ACF0H5_023096 [Mactra antiquata]
MSLEGIGVIKTSLFIVCYLVASNNGHGQLFDPPSRQSAFRFGFSTAINYNDMNMNCGGFYNQWVVNQGRCGICGDPYQGPRRYEAGGPMAKGIITRNYTEGQVINIKVNIRVGHGGWSEVRICPNNDINRPATQGCLDQYLLQTIDGATRVNHHHEFTGVYTYQFKLPAGLTCSQCVLQWRWNTDSNNNCHGNVDCCNGCGAQEQFYGCADVAITSSSGSIVTSSPTKPITTPHQIYVQTTPKPSTSIPIGGFIPIDVGGSTYRPSICTATSMGRYVFGPDHADSECKQLCALHSTCPSPQLCDSSCML